MIFYDLLDNRTWNVLACPILVIHALQPEGFHDTFSLQKYVQFSMCVFHLGLCSYFDDDVSAAFSDEAPYDSREHIIRLSR